MHTTPILGVCLGMQCINEVFEGKTVKAPVPVHGKKDKIYHEELGIFKRMPKPFQAARHHSHLPISAGLFGYLAYDMKDHIEFINRTTMDDLNLPDMYMTAPGFILVEDRVTEKKYIQTVELDNTDSKKYKDYIELFKENPAAFFSYINAGDHRIVYTSPERFILQEGTRVEAKPIKGTRPRGKTNIEDDILRKELQNSLKDEAELSMIVDLLRNNMGKVCKGGSIVYDSDPADEYNETLHKAQTLIRVMNQHRETNNLDTPKFYCWTNGKFLLEKNSWVSGMTKGFQHGMGVFETVKVKMGEIEYQEEYLKPIQGIFLLLKVKLLLFRNQSIDFQG